MKPGEVSAPNAGEPTHVEFRAEPDLNTFAKRTTLSICIPAYNRVQHLPALLDSIFAQDFYDYNIVICEDQSPERVKIAEVVDEYSRRHPGVIRYHENAINLGYDGNIRNLVARADGEFCFFMGNDDIMCSGALATVADLLTRNPDAGFVLKSYSWFVKEPGEIKQVVRYFREERRFEAGREAILLCYRRSGVISGYIVHRDAAHAVATDKYDGTLYYQMHLTAQVLARKPAVFTPEVLILCRDEQPPEFGNSASEKGKYTPGGYTPEARHSMVRGALSIIQDFQRDTGVQVAAEIQRDYANYFFVYIRDQLKLPLRRFFFLYRGYARMGFSKYPMFHLYCILGYMLGVKRFDRLTQEIRRILGRSPQFGVIGK